METTPSLTSQERGSPHSASSQTTLKNWVQKNGSRLVLILLSGVGFSLIMWNTNGNLIHADLRDALFKLATNLTKKNH